MKLSHIVLYIVMSVASVYADEQSMRREMAERGAQYCYRFSSWSENPTSRQFTLSLFFVAPAPSGSYDGYAEGLPLAERLEVVVETRANGKVRSRVLRLDSKRADEIACWIGYSGYFAADSEDPKHRYLDGKGLTGQRITLQKYSEKSRSFEEDLSCRWLYEKLEALAQKG